MPATHGLPAGARPETAESEASRPFVESEGASEVGPPSVALPPAPAPRPALPPPDPVVAADPPEPVAVVLVEPGPVIDEVTPAAPPWLLPVAPADPVEWVD